MTIDGLVLLGTSRYGYALSLPRLRADAGRLGVGRVVCAPAMPHSRNPRGANRRLAALERSSDGFVLAMARVDPRERDARDVAAEGLAGGAHGLFLHPWEETFRVDDAPLVDPLLAVAREHGAPVYLEAGFPWLSEPAQVGELARRHPDVTIVATRGNQMNMSGLATETAALALRQNPNLYVLTCGVYRQDWLDEIARELGPERLIYASLAPLYEAELELLRPRALATDAAGRALVLGGNSARLLRLRV